MTNCYIGIGSNINPEENLKACAKMLRADYPGITFSSVYRTAARDAVDQEDFLNAVAKIETDETAEELYETLKAIEKELGKDPPYPKGPRTIDLDILLYGNFQLSALPSRQAGFSFQLVIPHPRMLERRFVLEPLCELDPSWEEALKKTRDQECKKTGISIS